MNKLYVFAIGGSGERVLKSLALMLAAGTPIAAKEVIPVIVDNDQTSKALTDCKRILKNYGYKAGDNGVHTIYEKAFGQDQKEWPSFCHTHLREPVMLDIAGNTIGNLDKIIGCPAENPNDSNNEYIHSILIERDLLFTREDLEMPLNVGFVGNPNIGSVVINNLSFACSDFQSIFNGISSNDGVIVVGSLFGGTGAAGFPLIVNKFNSITDRTKKPVLGGVAMLPYFDTDKAKAVKDDASIDKGKWDVDSDTFATKTRAALMYYDVYMQDLDLMYYVGDDSRCSYPHSLGGPGQDNPANLMEVFAALSVIDFAKQGHQKRPIYKLNIWGFDDAGKVSNVSGITNPELKKAIVKFQMFELILKNDSFLKYAISDQMQASFVKEIGFTDQVRTSTYSDNIQYKFASGLNGLLKDWDLWLSQLADNNAKRQLMIYNHEVNTSGDDITKNFFANGEFGIAKSIIERQGFFINRREVEKAMTPDILDAMLAAYKELPDEMKRNVSEFQILPLEMLVISKALDKVIEDKCSL